MLPTPVHGLVMPTTGPLIDQFGREHTYIRISVTDRCNYRCVYCMPAEGLDWMPKDAILTYEEVARVARIFVDLGISKIRITGGEPTVRRDLPELVAALGALPGVRDLSMTTNGHLFAARAQSFADAGMHRVNISIDTLEPEQFRALTRGGDLDRVLQAIDASIEAGMTPVKLNAVMVAGENDDQLLALIEHFAPLAEHVQVRFIEAMPFSGAVRERTHLSTAAMRERIGERYTLEPAERAVGGGPATTWRIAENGLVVGFISPITEHFCHSCNRLRLQADGHLRTCLSREAVPSLRDLIRGGVSDDTLEHAIRCQVWGKVAGHEAHLKDGWSAFEGVMTSIGG
ncbi:MAG: GTP 3',8-cyclase MoaA [Myxococcota bacterium]